VADADEGLRLKPKTPEMFHNAACIFARVAGRPEGDSKQAADLRARAVAALGEGLELVPQSGQATFLYQRMLPDTDLDSIRGSAELKNLLQKYPPPRRTN